MPASTPVYGITYPCGGDTIDSSVFATFAESMDAALVQGAAEMAQVANKPNAQAVALGFPQLVTLNTVTTMTYNTEVYDNDNMIDLAVNNDRLTIQTSGAYLVWAMFATGSATTMTSMTVILTVNGTERGRYKDRPRSGVNFGQVEFTMPINLVAGDIVRAQALWTGSGGPSSFSSRILSASYLAAP